MIFTEIQKESFDKVMESTRESIAKLEETYPVLFLFKNDRVEPLAVALAVFDSPQGKDGFAKWAADLSKQAGADWLMFITEAWVVKAEKIEGLPEGESLKRATDEAYKHGESLESHPRREEIVHIMVQRAGDHALMMAPIIHENGKRRMGEIETIHQGEVKGRFSNLLGG